MKRTFCTLSVLLLSAVLCCGQERPSGLMTDLVEHTDTYFSGRLALIGSSRPEFSWIVPGDGLQTAYRIIVFKGKEKLWDSGVVQGSESTAVAYKGPALESSTDYSWAVRTETDNGGWSGWSETKWFRTAESISEYSTPSYPLARERNLPESIGKASNGNILLDFGKDSFGQLELTLSSQTDGDTILVHMGERLVDGELWRKPTTTVRYHCYPVALRKGTHSYRIKIAPDKRNTGPDAVKMPSYIGEVMPFRYCEVEGYKGALSKEDALRYTIHYPFDMEAASFTSSNDILNQVWELCRYSVKATSFIGVYVDGDRERIPYEADALISQLCHYGADREYTLARRTLEHLLEHPTWPTEWILQSVMIAWYDYMATGDKRLLSKEYDLLKAHCLMSLRDETGLVSTRNGKMDRNMLESINRTADIRDIVDWPQKVPEVDGIPGGSDGFEFTDYNTVVNAYCYKAWTMMAQIAEVLGNKEDAAAFRADANQLREDFHKAFYNKETGIFIDGKDTDHSSLHANLFPLALGVVKDEFRGSVSDYIASRGMSCGVYVAQFLLEALYDAGEDEAALRLMDTESTVGWYNMIRKGSTITMEAWDDTFKPNQDWNHLWGAAPGNIIPFYMMGIRPLEPGFSRIQVKPQTASLAEAEMKLPTIRGSIFMKTSFDATSGARTVELEVPANVMSHVLLPAEGLKRFSATVDGVAVKPAVTADGFLDFGEIRPGKHVFTVCKK